MFRSLQEHPLSQRLVTDSHHLCEATFKGLLHVPPPGTSLKFSFVSRRTPALGLGSFPTATCFHDRLPAHLFAHKLHPILHIGDSQNIQIYCLDPLLILIQCIIRSFALRSSALRYSCSNCCCCIEVLNKKGSQRLLVEGPECVLAN